MSFQVASKKMAKAKVAMIGPSGAGKTLSALLLARGLTRNGRVGILDSENNSASLYADKFPDWQYYVLPIAPPYTARKYLDAIDLAVREKLDCLIIDSLTHVWAGEGGLLQQKEALDSRAGSNSYTNWQQITKVHEAIKSKILYSPIHIVTTMRSKQEYVMETNDRGKSVPKKVGLKPIQRDDLEYEFTVVFDIGMDHQFMVSKDRTDLFDGMVAKVTEQTGLDISAWLCNDIATPTLAESKTETPAANNPDLPMKHPDKKDAPKPKTTKPVQNPPAAAAQATTVAQPPAPALTDIRQMTAEEMSGPDVPPADPPQPPPTPITQGRQVKNYAPGANASAPLAPPSGGGGDVDSGEYIIKCGQNWGMLGKRIFDLNESTLTAALKQADGMIAKGNADANVKEFALHARKFLREMGVAI